MQFENKIVNVPRLANMKKYLPHVMGAIFVLCIIGAWTAISSYTKTEKAATRCAWKTHDGQQPDEEN